MTVRRLTVGALEANCYLVSDDRGQTAVIDPGDEAERILAALRENGLTAVCILLTHGHEDHILAAAELRRETGAPVCVGREDAPLLRDPVRNLTAMMPGGPRRLEPDRLLEDREPVTAGALTLCFISTPGHTPGSGCFVCGDRLFSGDTLFAGSIGRTDLPGGDDLVMGRSLRRLGALEGDFRVYPGHGEETTLERERAENAYLLYYRSGF